MDYQTLKVKFDKQICYIQIYRPDKNNTINSQLITEMQGIIETCKNRSTVVILEGLPEIFCYGADFENIAENNKSTSAKQQNPELLYELWQELATGPFISIAHVKGKANAGGIGFVAACDIVIADNKASFSLSELLFGIYPACVLPFLIKKIGLQKSNYMTLMTQPVLVETAHLWGLVDAYHEKSNDLLRKHLLRLRLIDKTAIIRYKKYLNEINDITTKFKETAIKANLEVFSDQNILDSITKYVETGQFPWN